MEDYKEVPVLDESKTKKDPKTKRQGKGANQRNMDKFRQRKNKQTLEKFSQELRKQLKLFDDPESAVLEEVINTAQITPQTVAIPISSTTRGVGVATMISYDNICSTWNRETIEPICNIFQFYRVNLWLAFYKLFLAQQIQNEECIGTPFQRIYIDDEHRDALNNIGLVPSTVAIVLNSIGKIETDVAVYHMGVPTPPQIPVEAAEYRTNIVEKITTCE